MSSPLAWSSFFALITGGMKAPSDGGLKITMETFSSAWARRSVAPPIASARPSQAPAQPYRSNRIITLPGCLCRRRHRIASGEPEQFGRKTAIDRSGLLGRQPGIRHDAHGLRVADRERHVGAHHQAFGSEHEG